MLSIVIKNRVVAAVLLTLVSVAAFARDSTPRILNEPVLGLRLKAADLKLDPLPEEVRAMCEQTVDTERRTSRLWVFARANDARTTYYVVAGYFQRQHPASGEARYEPTVRGGMLYVTGNQCKGDPARETFEARNFEDTPQPVLQQLAGDLAARLTQAVGGADRLRAEIRNQHIDFEQLSPELQEAFKPYFEPIK